ncbi:MAG: F0F1 ATP synthase subunit gamma [Egibacteraceae bacterium]
MPGAGELRVLRRRIRSVKSTQKITRAMELIAASRIARARRAVESARPYAEGITEVMRHLAGEGEVADHPLLNAPDEPKRIGLVVISSDRGLAGAYNSNMLRKSGRFIDQQREKGREVRIYAIGRKAETFFRYRGEEMTEVWLNMSDRPNYRDAARVGETVVRAYREEEIDRVWLGYTVFRSALTQVATLVQLLPVDPHDLGEEEQYPPQFLFEPDPVGILERLVPRYIEHRIYAGLLESAASEHASRQRAMKAATDNANEIVEDLTREANRARQSAITTEITEIVGGAEALSGE